MNRETETQPLLPTFQNDAWRSGPRRWLRKPSQITVTSTILGLLLLAITLTVTIQSLKTTKKEDLRIDETLLGSPFKYNKKAEDKTWQNKKDHKKNVADDYDRKQDSINKGWKVVPDPAGGKQPPFHILKSTKKNKYDYYDDLNDSINESFKEEYSIFATNSDEYGKEVEDSSEEMSETDGQNVNVDSENMIEWMLLKSSIKGKEIDEGWKKLIEQGWTDKDLRQKIFKAWLKNQTSVESSEDENNMKSEKGDSEWKNFPSWKELRKKIFKDWLNNNTMMEPSEDKNNMKWKKVDDGWKIFQSWKDLREKIFKEWLNNRTNVEPSDDENNKKWKKVDGEWKNFQTSPFKYNKKPQDKMWKNKKHHKKNSTYEEDKNYDSTNNKWKLGPNLQGNEDPLYILQSTGNDVENNNPKEEIDNAWKTIKSLVEFFMENNNMKPQKSAEVQRKTLGSPFKYNKKTQDTTWQNKNDYKKNKIYTQQMKYNSINQDWKIKHNPIEINDAEVFPDETFDKNKIERMLLTSNMNWKDEDKGWNKLSEQGWKAKDLREEIYSAWAKAHPMVQSSTGQNDWKWKKVDNGWKKIDKTNIDEITS